MSTLFGPRPFAVLAFFILMGATQLTKGPLFGPVMTLAPTAGFVLLSLQPDRIRRYSWVWGWLAFFALGAAWPLAAYWRHPDVIDLWMFDLVGRMNGSYQLITQPWWYYLPAILWETSPWTIAVVIGLKRTARSAWADANSPERFLWLWGVAPIVLLSFASGKHHHYVIHCLPALAIVGSLALESVWRAAMQTPPALRRPALGVAAVGLPVAVALCLADRFVPLHSAVGPIAAVGWLAAVFAFWKTMQNRQPKAALAVVVVATAVIYCGIHSVALPIGDQTVADRDFFKQVRRNLPSDVPLFVNADGLADLSSALFYVHRPTTTLHNLGFLLDERISYSEVYVIARRREQADLEQFGTPMPIMESAHSHRESSPAERLTLFRLHFHPNLARVPVPTRISPQQAIGREPGPFVQ